MLILNARDVRQALPMIEAIAAMKEAFAALTEGRAIVLPRAHLPIERNQGISLFMPAYIDHEDSSRQALTIKAVSLFDQNQSKGLARIQAAVLVLDPTTGALSAVLEGATLTGIRTAAASGAATDLLARPDSQTVAILGAGVQARAHLEAICAIRPIERAFIHSPTPAKVNALMAEKGSVVSAELVAVESSREAIAEADIICCTSTSPTPIFDDADVRAGTHINAVGSYMPHVREVPSATVARSLVVIDSHEAAWEEAGDLIIPVEAGEITRDHVHAELGELVLGTQAGRSDDQQITFFKSVGIAAQDAFAAQVALANAKSRNLGQRVNW
ncbi:MAG: hypothetical protein CMJ64_26470 [Planctomycetaceae bacterium]|nr:hypothetical protein [Planctomycetaceae bacterium]